MHFNHLVERRHLKQKCKNNNSECYYVPVANGRATAGEHVHLSMRCKRCGQRNEVFLTKEEYFIQERLIYKELGDV